MLVDHAIMDQHQHRPIPHTMAVNRSGHHTSLSTSNGNHGTGLSPTYYSAAIPFEYLFDPRMLFSRRFHLHQNEPQGPDAWSITQGNGER
jgi:hypothetical protein